MKIVLPGGSGQIGTLLARAFQRDGHEVVVFSRNREAAPRTWRVIPWDGETVADAWMMHLDGADAVINLAGRSVNCRYTDQHRREILDSRVLSTRAIGAAIAQAVRPPRVWLQASTATIYAHRFDAPNDEATGIIEGSETAAEADAAAGAAVDAEAPSAWKFSVDVARAWEQALSDARTPRTRKVALRSAITMSPDRGGIFDTLLGLVRRGLGGRAADGRQYVSWVHEDDFVNAVRWLIDREDICGPINITAPNPLPNAAFMRALREAARIPIGLPATAWMLEIGAVLMRTETELILKSRRVVPRRLLEQGFTFKYPLWPEAARDLYERWQRIRV
jgi:NAD dependent epimerase/dehydratase family enzyme